MKYFFRLTLFMNDTLFDISNLVINIRDTIKNNNTLILLENCWSFIFFFSVIYNVIVYCIIFKFIN